MPEQSQVAAEIAAFNAAIQLAQLLIPKIAALLKSGQITIEEQLSVKQNYDLLRAQGELAFTGPEWEVEA